MTLALFRRGFPTATPYGLTLPRHTTRWLIMQKVRGHSEELPLLCRHMISGAISLPSRGSFHLSLTVLVHYRSVRSTSPWRMVPPDSLRIPRVRRYSGTSPTDFSFHIRGFHPLCRSIPRASANFCRILCESYNPAPETWDGLGCSAFARRYLRSLF